MNYNHPERYGSTVSIRLACAIIFFVFSFGFLYFFQTDILAVAQHVLSKGATRYQPLFGAILITLVGMLLQLFVYGVIRLRKRGHALTYLPSMLLLAAMTNIDYNMSHYFIAVSWWVFALILVVWILLAFFVRAMQNLEPDAEPTGVFSRAMWINLLTMSLMIIGVVSMSNTNAVFHYRMRAESCLLKGDYAGALKVGDKSLESDADLQMIRMYALTRTGELAEKLFAYPVSGNSTTMLPVEEKSSFAMYPVDSLYRYLGARPASQMTNSRYLQLMQKRDSVDDKRIADYQLCGLLLDKRIDEFAHELQIYYAENDTLDIDRLPRHYREAMTLYTHLRSHPVIIYRHSVMDEDWNNLQELESQYSDKTERKVKVEEQYRGTYWYYYKYE